MEHKDEHIEEICAEFKEKYHGNLFSSEAFRQDIVSFLRIALTSYRTALMWEKRKEIEGMKRTDETQMSHDHTYDKALDDVLSLLK